MPSLFGRHYFLKKRNDGSYGRRFDMIKIDRNYYLISEEEVTDKMELLSDGKYQLDGNLYEVINKEEESSVTSQKSSYNQSRASTSYSVDFSMAAIFILSALLLAFAVLCLYLGISDLVYYWKVVNESGQIGAAGEIIADGVEKYLRDGVLWIVGGVASLILGSLSALIYNTRKQ